jgi:Ca2+-binding RTX toxin-like protein
MSRRLILFALTIAVLTIPVVSSPAAAAKPKCMGQTATIVGTNGPDIIVGTRKKDVIVAKAGEDTIHGNGGGDIICAGSGNDIVSGGGGKDKIFGGRGSDLLRGNGAYDLLNGGIGLDECLPGKGGAKLVRCSGIGFVVRGADLEVEVTGSYSTYDFYGYYIRIKNNGPAKVSYALKTAEKSSGAMFCYGYGEYQPFSGGTLASGQQFIQYIPYQCKLGSPVFDPSFTLSATVSVVPGTGNDPVPGNNSDSKRLCWETYSDC